MSSSQSPADRALQNAWPLVAAPIADKLTLPAPGGRCFIVGRDGLYAAASSLAMTAVARISDGHTPFGDVAEQIILPYGPVPRDTLDDLARLARDAFDIETAAVVLLDPASRTYVIERPEILSTSAGEVTYDERGIDRTRLLIDFHSHGRYASGFSRTDDRSDLSRIGPHISLVIGHCDQPQMDVSCRLVTPPYLVPIDLAQVFA